MNENVTRRLTIDLPTVQQNQEKKWESLFDMIEKIRSVLLCFANTPYSVTTVFLTTTNRSKYFKRQQKNTIIFFLIIAGNAWNQIIVTNENYRCSHKCENKFLLLYLIRTYVTIYRHLFLFHVGIQSLSRGVCVLCVVNVIMTKIFHCIVTYYSVEAH